MRTTALIAAGLLAVAPLSLSAHEHGAADAGPEGRSGKFESAADCWYPAFKAGDADAVAACYVEDGVMVFPGGPLAQAGLRRPSGRPAHSPTGTRSASRSRPRARVESPSKSRSRGAS